MPYIVLQLHESLPFLFLHFFLGLPCLWSMFLDFGVFHKAYGLLHWCIPFGSILWHSFFFFFTLQQQSLVLYLISIFQIFSGITLLLMTSHFLVVLGLYLFDSFIICLGDFGDDKHV